jgi:hypothetical protein
LYLNTLDTVAAVRRLVGFYVQQYNEVMPHSALFGRTPDEVYFGKAGDIRTELQGAQKAARAERLATNRTVTCDACTATQAPTTTLEKAA